MMRIGQTPSGSLRVLVVDEGANAEELASQLQQLGHSVVGRATSLQQVSPLPDGQNPELIIACPPSSSDDTVASVQSLAGTYHCPVIVIDRNGDVADVARATQGGAFGYLFRPIRPESLRAQIEIAVHRFADQEQLRQQVDQLTLALETRKLVEKAKGILMKRLNLDEEEAHRRLQKESQKRRVNMAEIAKRVIESDELLGA